MTCPTATNAQHAADVERARQSVLAALAPLLTRHGTAATVAATAHVLGEMIGFAKVHGQLGGTVAEQLAHVQTMVGLGLRQASAALHAPEGRA
ncbi:hypothetical protein [Roseococcus microcysteis]|uniref:hypothetical protein n=1 Tax=Roseococcus microcysteis TaxID=2771361 RepID=UPI00168A75D6|nr:hypothetical protein [Roseococcus microcysteis]